MSSHCCTSPMMITRFHLGVEGASVVAGTAHSHEACWEPELPHVPNDAIAWINLGVLGGGMVVGTAFSERAAMSSRCSTSSTTRLFGSILESVAEAWSLAPRTARYLLGAATARVDERGL